MASFQRTAKFRGPDLDSAVPAELVGVAGRLNNALRRLGSGWAIFVEAQRHPAGGLSRRAISRMRHRPWSIVERRARVRGGRRRITRVGYFLTFLYLPPAEDAARAERLLYEGRDQAGVDAMREAAARLHRSHRPRAAARRGLHARSRMAR